MKGKSLVRARPPGIEPALTLFTIDGNLGTVFVEVAHDFESPHQVGIFLGKAVHSLAGAFAATNPGTKSDDAIELIIEGISDVLDQIRARTTDRSSRGH
jgi:hypothetical protein